ncbi:hypothetical protein HYALB_00013531 [Hymenoscyphus albidus]|uniref:Cytochrome P450 n=1 Tax=Hymenoscyphus albidus TaxID=595503 RepID=A0A9N9LZX1_9HELO|nr:hypothetical protein HYALB_00013531 [Hymenoscyphus albidus]
MSYQSAIALAYTFVILVIIKYFIWAPRKHHTAPRRLRNVKECLYLLKSSTLKQRASPNQRLVIAFGIDNAFTTVDPIHAKRFVNQSKSLLRTQGDDWKMLTQFASDWTKQVVFVKLQTSCSFRLLPMVQALVFHTVLRKFFPAISTPSDSEVEFITSRINSLWIASKGIACQDKTQLVYQRKEFQSRLQSTFSPNKSQSGEENPLNILLPAYETLWRVVLRIFLEVQFLSEPQRVCEYAAQFEKFLLDPTRGKFEEETQIQDGLSVSIKGIVAEGLRLYPPTRRIYREIDGEEVAVDVEYLHRDATNWGDDAMRFIPGRWATLTTCDAGKRGYMPFGAGTFECPAKPEFGLFAIGIMVGVLVTKFANQFELNGGDDLGPLENVRDAYSELELRRKI